MKSVLGLGMSVCLWAALGTPTAAQEKAHAVVEPSPRVPKGKVLEWKSKQGQPFWYRIPKQINSQRPPNLVFMLHGTGMKWGWAFWNYPIEGGGFRGDDIVIAPEGMTPDGRGTFNFLQGKKDGEQIVSLIEMFQRAFPTGNVYLYGHSQGAFFCYWAAGEYPELIDGIVAHAGNVLSVKHSKLAREKVAIGILHGRADAVVPVSCAIRTEQVYREQGYAKIKLEIVEGLNEHTGHWPLPDHVARMFDWLDQVSAKTPRQALAILHSEVQKDPPSLTVLAAACTSAEKTLKSYRGSDRDQITQEVQKWNGLMQTLAAAHAQALEQDPATSSRKLTFGPWAIHFAAAHRAFRGNKTWDKRMKTLSTTAGKHEKTVFKTLKSLAQPDRRSFLQGARAVESCFLADRYEELRNQLKNLIEAPPEGVPEKDRTALRAVLDARQEDERQGHEQAVSITQQIIEQFRQQEADLLSPNPETPSDS